MQRVTNLALLAGALLAGWAGTANAQAYGQGYGHAPRQYYSDWKKAPEGNYYARKYYSKPTPDYIGYKTHEVRYFPAKPQHYYYYNPKSQKYWGRCPTEMNGKAAYSLLKMEDRHGDLNKIQESAFPPPGKMPPIPDSDPKEGATVDLPPDDAPPVGAAPAP